MERNVFVFLYKQQPLSANIVKNLLELHSKKGRGFRLHILTDENIQQYITLPYIHDLLSKELKIDYYKVSIIQKYGGIWLDTYTLLMENLDRLFALINTKEGFFFSGVKESMSCVVFGSRPYTTLMNKWKLYVDTTLEKLKPPVEDKDLGDNYLNKFGLRYMENYLIFSGKSTIYPCINSNNVDELIFSPFVNYKKHVREFQPLIILDRGLFKVADRHLSDLFTGDRALTYFLNKAVDSVEYRDEKEELLSPVINISV